MFDRSPEGEGEALRFEHTLEPKAYLGLSLKLGILNLITLTLFRFWSKTEVRRRVWRSIRMNGEAFEYTGRGVELFIGFLLALLVLGAPFLLLVFAVQFLGPVWALLYLPLYIFVFWLWGFGLFTAFRYMASRTTWRGIRFRLRGSAKGYGTAFLGYSLLSAVTFGWFWPVAERKLAELIWQDLKFGDRPFRFSMVRAEKVGVYGPYALGWFGSIVLYVAMVTAVVSVIFAMGLHEVAEPSATDLLIMQYAPLATLAALSPLFALVWAPYKAAMLRSIAAGIGLDEARFALKVRILPLWWLTVSNIFLVVITLGILMPFVQARTVRFMVERLASEGAADMAVARQAAAGPKSGEGLADAFGFSAI